MICETCGGHEGREFGAYQVCEPCQKKHWKRVRPNYIEARYDPNYTDELLEEDAQRWERGLRDHGSDPEDQSWEDIMGGVEDEYFQDGAFAAQQDTGARVAEFYAREWARTEDEYVFMIALSVGHTKADAQRLSGLTVHQARHLVDRIRNTYPRAFPED
jgi:hypothetical protein